METHESKMCGYINEELGRLLLTHARSETKKANDVLHNDGNIADHRYLTLVLAGEVLVVRTKRCHSKRAVQA